MVFLPVSAKPVCEGYTLLMWRPSSLSETGLGLGCANATVCVDVWSYIWVAVDVDGCVRESVKLLGRLTM